MTMHRPFLNLSLRPVGYHRTDEAVELDEGRRSSVVGLEGPVGPDRSVVGGESSQKESDEEGRKGYDSDGTG